MILTNLCLRPNAVLLCSMRWGLRLGGEGGGVKMGRDRRVGGESINIGREREGEGGSYH